MIAHCKQQIDPPIYVDIQTYIDTHTQASIGTHMAKAVDSLFQIGHHLLVVEQCGFGQGSVVPTVLGVWIDAGHLDKEADGIKGS